MLSSLFPGSSANKDEQQKQRRKRQSPAPSTIPRHRSCEGCRLRKLKCSRTENCLQCQKRNAQCVWLGSAPSRSTEDATLEQSEAEVLRLNKVIMQLEARIAKMEHGQAEPDMSPVTSTSGSVLTRTTTASSESSDVDHPSPPAESMRPSTSSSRASSIPPMESGSVQTVTHETYAHQQPHHYGAGAPASRFSASRAPTSRPTPSIYSVDSYNVPSLTASSSVTSFASSLQTVPDGYHLRDPRYNGGHGGHGGHGGRGAYGPPPPHHQQHHFYAAPPPSQPAPQPQVHFYAPPVHHNHQTWTIEEQQQHRPPIQHIKEEVQEFSPYEAFTRAFGGGANRW